MNEVPPRSEKRSSKEFVRQELFLQMIAGRIVSSFVDDFKDALFDAGISDHERIETIASEFVSAFSELPEADKNAVLAIPFELRAQKLERIAKNVVAGAGGEDAVVELRDANKAVSSTLGYHMSPINIPQPLDPGRPWRVKGAGEHVWQGNPDKGEYASGPMAFYSLDYLHRYLKKPAPFLYVVVGKQKEGEGHGRSNAGTWGHAPNLDIIEKVDMLELEAELEKRMKDLHMQKKQKGEAA